MTAGPVPIQVPTRAPIRVLTLAPIQVLTLAPIQVLTPAPTLDLILAPTLDLILAPAAANVGNVSFGPLAVTRCRGTYGSLRSLRHRRRGIAFPLTTRDVLGRCLLT